MRRIWNRTQLLPTAAGHCIAGAGTTFTGASVARNTGGQLEHSSQATPDMRKTLSRVPHVHAEKIDMHVPTHARLAAAIVG